MKVSYDWLKELLDLKISPEDLAQRLTMAGLEVGRTEKIGSDTIFEIEITANRPDCLSILGMAQEVAAITGTKLKTANYKIITPKKSSATKKLIPNFIVIEDKKDCLLYRACLIENVYIGPSPEWLSKRLEALGIRSVNNIVDITNYCLLEYGQPLHAFDYDKIAEQIIVRRAKKREKIITIDGTEHQLDENVLVISDKNSPIAIAGIMGGKDSEVTEHSKTILLESAYFEPILTRRASRQLGLSSESSYRFERGVDLERVKLAQDRTVSMICDFAKATLSDAQQSGQKIKPKLRRVILDCRKANKILSLNLSREKISRILASLGFRCRKAKNLGLDVEIPALRRDVLVEEDLIEEIARIYGYDNIPSTTPAVRTNLILNKELEEIKPKIGQCLEGLGYYQAITYSLISQELLDAAFVKSQAVKLMNPLTKEQELLRPLLCPSLINSVVYNLRHNNNDLQLFEISHIFSIEKGEVPSVGIIATGSSLNHWQAKREFDFFVLKGDILTLCQKLGVEGVEFFSSTNDLFKAGESADIKFKGKSIGIIGRIKEDIVLNFDIKNNPSIFYAEIFLDECAPLINFNKRFRPISPFPSAFRDISIIVKQSVRYGDMAEVIKGQSGAFLKDLRLVDVYKGKQIPEGFMGMTLSLEYGLDERTLTDAEVAQMQDKIVNKLITDFEIKIR